jgi:hypothetical protein
MISTCTLFSHELAAGTIVPPQITKSVCVARSLLQLQSMVLSAASLSPVLALVFGVLIFIFPRLLNYLVALYLVLSGLLGLGVLAIR